jgi:hypothetical protein
MTGGSPDDGSFRDFGYFFNYYEMRDTLRALTLRHPQIAQLDSSMRSLQNRPLYCIKVSDNPQTLEGEPQVFLNGATHAREPLSTHTCVAFASLLCRDYGADSLVTWLVNSREIYIIPVMNPDGYAYNSDSGGTSSNWRKNRHIIQSPYVGIDLNRNYGYKWGYDDVGSSPSPSSETYRGPARWSEPEVAAIRDFEAAHKFRTGIDFHTYGRDNLYPWAYAGSTPPELALIQEIADTFMANNGYASTGQWYSTLYPSNGTSVDWELSDTLLNGNSKFVGYFLTSELGINDFWYGASDPAYVDAEVALNVPNCYYFTRLCGVYLDPAGMIVNDTSGGNANGQLDPGETASLWFRVTNRALHALDTAQAITAVLRSADTLVQVLTPSASFPAMPRRTNGDNHSAPIQVRCSPNAGPGTNVALRLEVTFSDDGATIMQPVNFRIVIGSHPVAVADLGQGGAGSRPRLEVRTNPACGRVLFGVRVPASERPASLAIYGPDGRLVRHLFVGAHGQCRQEVGWDGNDETGRSMPAGVYLVELRTARPPCWAKVVFSY